MTKGLAEIVAKTDGLIVLMGVAVFDNSELEVTLMDPAGLGVSVNTAVIEALLQAEEDNIAVDDTLNDDV